MRPMIELRSLTKRYGGAVAADSVTLEIASGEFFSLLGPSGCGKTTTLRMIAGFEEPSEGTVILDGEDVTWVSPRKRKVNMVFQDYALFPHMSVYENVAFGLKLSRVAKSEIRERVGAILASVRLEGYETRLPAQLSGGQRQRVALARALVNEPAALLLDEPLGALDLKLRKEMQLELKAIQQRTGTTFVYVTHDQEEALTMSDRIAVMNGGRVEQVDTARAVYDRPATGFVADFIGTSNLLTLRVDRRAGGAVTMDLGEGHVDLRPRPRRRSRGGPDHGAPGEDHDRRRARAGPHLRPRPHRPERLPRLGHAADHRAADGGEADRPRAQRRRERRPAGARPRGDARLGARPQLRGRRQRRPSPPAADLAPENAPDAEEAELA